MKKSNADKVVSYRLTEREKAKGNRASRPRPAKPEKTPSEVESEKKRKIEYIKQWKKANPEKVKEYSRRSAVKHRERIRQYGAKWRKENPEAMSASITKYRAKHSDKVKASQASYYYANREDRIASATEWRRNNPEKAFEIYRSSFIRRRFGLTPQDYDRMMKEQNGLCAICKHPETATCKGRAKLLAVDHHHVTGTIRGLLCAKCNTLVAHCRESLDVLDRAKLYLTGLLPNEDRVISDAVIKGLNQSPKTRYERVNRPCLMRRLYGITDDVYLRLLLEQGGSCRICNQVNESGKNGKAKKLSVDHDHKTLAIRGLLCTRCNFMIGCANDNVSILNCAMSYLERWSCASG